MTAEKVRENRLRRMADRRGLLLVKSRIRDPRAFGFGGYMLLERERNLVVIGGDRHAFSATLDDVEDYLTAPVKAERKRVAARKRP